MRPRLPLFAFLVLGVLVMAPGAHAASVHGRVLDGETGRTIPGANVSLFRAGETTPIFSVLADSNGSYTFGGLSAGAYRLQASAPGYRGANRTLTLSVNETAVIDLLVSPPTGGLEAASSGGFPLFIPMILTTAALLGALLFARIHRNELLQNVVRQRIFEHVRANPGKHYRAVLADLDLAMGVLTYHLNTLERAGYVTSRQDGVYRRFYPAGHRTELTFFLTEVQQGIVLALRENGGISQARLAESLAISRPLVNYHLHVLADAGLVRLEPRGRETGCFLAEG